MVYTTHTYYSGKNGSARIFDEDIIYGGIADAIRKQSGSLRYEFFFPVGDNETVLLIDSWDDQALSDDWCNSNDIVARIVELREKYELQTTFERYVREEL